ncbi:expansin-like EG45 domain-containing protein [Haematococcus lacustris]|uniref:Expansin-like EG45 domain-containing protein n=1 Tax=Haematococcus lacustris TaxID=44745 RepID=A0A699ZYW2_HAELA|nr:expansin-like EG45 domain-containing protein [Haematococcus lacustris]
MNEQSGYLDNKFGGKQNWMVAAINDGHPRYGGSCGRCYQIRCRPAVIVDNYGQKFADPKQGVIGIEYQEVSCPKQLQQALNPSVQKPRLKK